jgi:acetyl-CoA decarbonylase/synthase complex subunit alpha
MGNVDREKPVLAFVGDNFLPGWVAINRLKEEGKIDQVEICGIGPAGDDIARFYDKCRIVGPMTKAAKLIRSGFADVIVASSSCIPLDIVAEAKRVESRLIWVGRDGGRGLRDRINDPIDEIGDDLLKGEGVAWIRDVEKAGEVAARVILEAKGNRKGDYVMSEEAAKAEAGKCLPDCDLCFSVCPNSLPISKAMMSMQADGLKALLEVEKGCYFCGKCEEACPAKLPLRDMIAAAYAQRAKDDKFVMRAGRGPVSRMETAAYAFPLMWGNGPGLINIIGCGDAAEDDLGWIANELAFRNCITFIAGCAAAESARYFDQKTKRFVFEKYGGEAMPRNLVNCGGCSACAHLVDESYKYARTGAAISYFANYAETTDEMFNLFTPVTIIWGALPEKMYAIAAGLARAGLPIIIGPNSGFGWKRFLTGNKWDWKHWWIYDTFSHAKKCVEPSPKHMIIPVETKEEAVAMALFLVNRPTGIRDTRQTQLDNLVEMYLRTFGEMPDDLHLFVRVDFELPVKYKAVILKELREKHGWEVERFTAKKAKHPDGRVLDLAEFQQQYDSALGMPVNRLGRLLAKPSAEEVVK